MAARIRKGTKTVPMPDSWRQKIRLTEIMNRVQDGFFGSIELTPEQIKCAQLILSKVVPDLARQELTGPGGSQLTVQVLKLGDNPEMLEKLRLQMFPSNVKATDHERDDNGA